MFDINLKRNFMKDFILEIFEGTSEDTACWLMNIIEDKHCGVDLFAEGLYRAFKGSREEYIAETGDDIQVEVLERKELLIKCHDYENELILPALVIIYYDGDKHENYDEFKKAVLRYSNKPKEILDYMSFAHTDAVITAEYIREFIIEGSTKENYYSGLLFR